MSYWPARRPRVALLPVCLLLVLTPACQALRIGALVSEKPEKELPLTAPGKKSLRVSQFVFLSDFELQRELPIFQDLSRLRDQVYAELKLPPANTVVQIHLFEDRERYEKFIHARYPELPKRRAFFVAQPRGVGSGEDLLVYTYWGERIQQDLRHELTHALLHSVLKDVPLWLDEGLAEYFETPADWHGINYLHLDQMRRGAGSRYRSDLARLEQLSQVQQMTPAEYREAWAWAHLMLRGQPEAKAVLLNYLQALRTNPNPGPLAPRLTAVVPNLEETLAEHLTRLDVHPRPVTAVQR